MWVRSLGQEDPLEEGTATHSSILACRLPWTEELGGYNPWGRKELDTTEVTECAHMQYSIMSLYHTSFIYPSVNGHLNCFHF